MLRGEVRPADAVERVDLAQVAEEKGLHAMAARLFAEAFTANPSMAEDLEAGYRYNAACSAVLAGCGKGKDQPPPDESARIQLRRQALDWLEADLAARSRIVANRSPDRGSASRRGPVLDLEHWKHDPDLAGVRDRTALKELSPADQASWRAFWADVGRVLTQSTIATD